jgi:DNA-binding NarL/FixJ family response regulator
MNMRDAKLKDTFNDHGASHSRQTPGVSLVVMDDKPDYRAVLRSLSEESGLNVVGECSDERNAMALLRRARPAIAIVDVHTPHMNGIEIIRTLHREIPQIRFIASTGHALDELFDIAMKNGTSAFVLKTDLIREFKDVIATVVGGHRYVSRAALERLLDRHIEMVQPLHEENRLTARQCNVVGLVARGFSNKEVAVRLNITESTVEKHRAAAMQRLGLLTAADLVRYVLATGLIDSKSEPEHRNRR